jgi:uncharacterized protein
MIGWVQLVPELFEQVLVPRPVWREVVEQGAGLPGSSELAAADWASVVDEPEDDEMLAVMLTDLDRGEAAATALAVACRAERLLVDDRAARRVAVQLGVPVIGTLGILLAARRRGSVERLAPLLSALRANGFWMSLQLETSVLEDVGETRAEVVRA